MNPEWITLHCSATQNKPSITKEVITEWHLQRGFTDIGYHFVIETDGKIRYGRPIHKKGAHTFGHNQSNIGICLVGGIDENGKSVMNFTPIQQATVLNLVLSLQRVFNIPNDNVKGHRDWSKDLNSDGEIDRSEWMKDCPCFDVSKFMKSGVMVFE